MHQMMILQTLTVTGWVNPDINQWRHIMEERLNDINECWFLIWKLVEVGQLIICVWRTITIKELYLLVDELAVKYRDDTKLSYQGARRRLIDKLTSAPYKLHGATVSYAGQFVKRNGHVWSSNRFIFPKFSTFETIMLQLIRYWVTDSVRYFG